MSMSTRELSDAIKRARVQCQQEIDAATIEYNDARRPIAARRKQRAAVARQARDALIAELRNHFAGGQA